MGPINTASSEIFHNVIPVIFPCPSEGPECLTGPGSLAAMSLAAPWFPVKLFLDAIGLDPNLSDSL